MRELSPGTVVDGRYRIVARLGSGGMADVYCAEDAQLGRQVALKILYGRFAEDDEFVERFRREASHAAGLQHQHIVSVYDRGEWEGTSYIAMEYVDGRTLKQVIQAEAPLEPLQAIDLAVQVLRAARFAHRRGVIHRDLKPHNVIVDDEGRAKVTDFGIARAGASDMTETGSIMGTAQYLSPEQAQGHAVTPRSDLYSVGICLYEMLTGRVPFEAESAVTIALKQVNEAPVPPSHYNTAIPAALEDAVLRALAKDPEERFADADAFIDALEEARRLILAGDAPPAQPTAAFAAAAVAPSPAGQPHAVPAATAVAPEGALLEEEAFRESAPPAGRRWPWGLVAVLLVTGAVIAAALLLGGGAKVKVPSVVKTRSSAAAAVLHRAGLEVEIDNVVSEAPRGIVISQDPPAGSRVKKGTTVALSVSEGPGSAQVPVVDGKGRRTARRILTRAGFKVSERKEASDSVATDHVVRTTPPAGSQLDLGRTVTMYVSAGPKQVDVPDVVGKQVDDAGTVLRDAGFDVSTQEKATTGSDPGTVLAQDPAAGGQADMGSTIKLTVAKAPEDVAIPDVEGETASDAIRALSAAGFEIDQQTKDVNGPEGDGVVITQRPKGGGKAKRGSRVTITVGRFNPAPNPQGTQTTPTPGADTGTGQPQATG